MAMVAASPQKMRSVSRIKGLRIRAGVLKEAAEPSRHRADVDDFGYLRVGCTVHPRCSGMEVEAALAGDLGGQGDADQVPGPGADLTASKAASHMP